MAYIEVYDVHIARKLWEIRNVRNVSKSKLAEVLGVSEQKYQEYEVGEAHISAAKLFLLSKFFEIDISFFTFDEEEEINRPIIQNDEIEILNFYQSIRDVLSKEEMLAILKSAVAKHRSSDLTH